MITILLIVATIAYVLLMLYVQEGLRRANIPERVIGYEPCVSIIVAARNEEEYLAQCIESLLQIQYPREKLEIIIVNDNSTDRTPEIIEQYYKTQPIIIINAIQGKGNLLGKTNAITQGIEASTGEILMFTDADCVVSPYWVNETVQFFDKNVGIVGGYTLLKASRIFEGMQTLDWLYLFSIASAAAGWKTPLTVIGNNFSVRRSAYDATGGYRGIPFSVTEDHALVQAISAKSAFKIRFPMNARTVVESHACQSWSQLFRQKQRWGVGGLDMVPLGILNALIIWIFRFFVLAGLVWANPLNVMLSVLGLFVVDGIFIGRPLHKFNAMKHFKYFIAFEIYCTLYGLIVPFIALASRKIVWKERTL